MEYLGYNTKVFKDIFPNFETFIEWYSKTPFYTANSIDGGTFYLILYEYADSHVAFSEESFKQKFAIDLYTYVKEFQETTKAINDLMELTDNQLLDNGKMITNIADIPATPSSTDVGSVNFITQQQKILNEKPLLQIKKEQLSNKRILTVKTFLNRFRHLFIRIISEQYNLVYGEEDNN